MSEVGIVPEIRDRLGTLMLGDRLPCGCWMATALVHGARTLVTEPCSLDCRFYLYVVDESMAQGKHLEVWRDKSR